MSWLFGKKDEGKTEEPASIKGEQSAKGGQQQQQGGSTTTTTRQISSDKSGSGTTTETIKTSTTTTTKTSIVTGGSTVVGETVTITPTSETTTTVTTCETGDKVMVCPPGSNEKVYVSMGEAVRMVCPVPKPEPRAPLSLNAWRNGWSHYTEEYEINEKESGLVIRRGGPFTILLGFGETSVEGYDQVTLEISTCDYEGAKRKIKKEWKIHDRPYSVPYVESDAGCPIYIDNVILSKDGKTADVQLMSRFNSPTSKYFITEVTFLKEKKTLYSSKEKSQPIYLIYNPFNPVDSVYMDVKEERDEYVLNDNGRVYYGTSRKIGSMPWFFGQFEDPVLDCAFLLLAKSDLAWEKWGDPIEVSRTLSALVNNLDDDGVLVGNWSGSYDDGKSPTYWKGSHRIIKQYIESKKPVKYGQCWVFSGCMTSLMRTLGMPARSVTNFDSAHDTDTNLTIDSFFDESYSSMPDKNSDSIWNFHVWNDVWMKRPDLGKDFNGWQAVDATPQEKSKGVYRAGPASVTAIKKGRVDLPHDSPFIYAEVNACIKHWVQNKSGQKVELYSDPKKVGQFISTKAVGTEERQDITKDYKFDEGTQDERESFETATKKLNQKCDRKDDSKKPRALSVKVNAADFHELGKDVNLEFEIENKSQLERKNVKFTVDANVTKYTGKVISKVSGVSQTVAVPKQASFKHALVIPATEYLVGCSGEEETALKITATIVDGNEISLEQTEIHFFRPEIGVSITGELKQNANFNFTCKFKNPLKKTLTNSVFLIDGPGLRGEVKEAKVADIAEGKEGECSFSLTPLRCGKRQFIISFSSDQLKGIGTQIPVNIAPAPEMQPIILTAEEPKPTVCPTPEEKPVLIVGTENKPTVCPTPTGAGLRGESGAGLRGESGAGLRGEPAAGLRGQQTGGQKGQPAAGTKQTQGGTKGAPKGGPKK